VYELLPEERAAICEFALQNPKIGYRKFTWMMVDAGIACVGESTVYRVLSDADLLSRWKRSTVSRGSRGSRKVVVLTLRHVVGLDCSVTHSTRHVRSG
jgi:hypothetical protein